MTKASEQGRVLLVDDMAVNRALLAKLLQLHGHSVTCAGSGAEALTMLGAGSFDLVLLDVNMPDMSGYELLERIKGDPASRHLPVIMLSALGDEQTLARCIELGADDYLFKPFNVTLFKARVQSCLEKKRLHAQGRHTCQGAESTVLAGREFVSLVAHELKNPLTALRSYTDLLLAAPCPAQQQREYLTTMRELVDRMSASIGELTARAHADRSDMRV